jgi:hypothetical protein
MCTFKKTINFFKVKVDVQKGAPLLENHDQINRKSTENQQIYVDWGTAMTDFTDFATFCKNQQFAAYFFVDSNSTMTKSTKY